MPRLDTARRTIVGQYNGAKTIGQIHKDTSDFLMEATWDNDIQTKECYIYDYKHDDSPTLNKNIVYTKDTTKTKISAKFIIASYASMDKSQVAYHLMFKPSEQLVFNEGDEMYYYETGYRQRYSMEFPLGMYVDIPDDKGVYCRWLIVDYEEANQFMKYLILPCDYRFNWIQIINGKKYKKYMWGCIRGQASYTSGEYLDRIFTRLDNVDKFMLPLNDITETFNYSDEIGYQQRLVISAKVKNPNTWEVSKLENIKPIGVLQVTVKQTPFDPVRDYIEYDENGNITDMWCDWFTADKADPVDVDPPPRPTTDILCELAVSSPTIKVNGSYRTVTATYTLDGEDVSEECAGYPHEWRFYVDDFDEENRIDQLLIIKDTDNPNIIKIKFANDRDYIGRRILINLNTNVHVHGWLATPLTIIG